MTVLGNAVAAVKAALPMPRGGQHGPAFWNWTQASNLGITGNGLPGERDYRQLVGDGSNNSIVVASIGWIATQFAEPRPVLTRDLPTGVVPEVIRRHPAVDLLRRPTWDPTTRRAAYGGGTLRSAMVTSYWLDANAYALKVRDERDLRVKQLWYCPHWMIEPMRDKDGTTVYEYRPFGFGSTPIILAASEVWHVRMGIDPSNPLKGWNRLKAILREVYTDEQAARFTASMLKNRGMPGVILAPSKETTKGIPEGERLLMKAKYESEFGGDKVGGLMVFGQPTSLTEFGFSPQQMELGNLRDIPEERITAITMVPAAVVGFGTGLQGAKVGATLREYREQAWENNLIPTCRVFAEEYTGQVLPDFLADADLLTHETAFDLSDVGALQDLTLKKAEVAARLVSGGIAQRNEGRARVGLPPVEGGDTFTPQPGVAGDAPKP